MTLTDKELHHLLTEARRDAGNEAVRLKVQLAEETESHAKTAKELQEKIEELKARLAAEIDVRSKDHVWSCKEKNARIAELEKERDKFKQFHAEAMGDFQAKVAECATAWDRLETLKAENDSLRADAGYWRALTKGWNWSENCPTCIKVYKDGSAATFYDDTLIEFWSRLSYAVERVTCYKPEVPNEA